MGFLQLNFSNSLLEQGWKKSWHINAVVRSEVGTICSDECCVSYSAASSTNEGVTHTHTETCTVANTEQGITRTCVYETCTSNAVGILLQ
jgi:hypothetical protein